VIIAVRSHDVYGYGESRGFSEELGEERTIVPLTGGHRGGYGELRVRAGDDVKLVAEHPLTGARLLRPGGIGVRRLPRPIFLPWVAVGLEEGGVHHHVFTSYHAGLDKPVHSLVEDPLEGVAGAVVLEPREGGLVWNPVEAQPLTPRWMPL